MHFPFTVEPAELIERPNRFVIHARLASGETVRAHCPNPGRMHELMIPGATVYLDRADDPNRRTPYTLRFIEHPAHGQLISLNTQLPNALFAEGLQAGFFASFCGYANIQAEVKVPDAISTASPGKVSSRIDFRLADAAGRACWVETKSATLVHPDGSAHFPDAPTARGRRHVEELTALAATGDRAAVVFIVQRPDAVSIAPNWQTDPKFAEALAHAAQNRVELYAYTCGLSTEKMWLEKQIPVIIQDTST